MRKGPQPVKSRTANQYAICEHKFGLVRHYAWRTALCSKECKARFKSREEGDSIWLGTGGQSVCFGQGWSCF
jgi:hypothetical protein